MTKEPVTKVIFKKEGKDVIAFFPEHPGNDEFDVECYAHVGQHASAALAYLSACKPAKPEEYADLKAELESIGYKLEVIRRTSPRHFAVRKAAMNRSAA
jgi:predicted protein tyrosine phosphatase